DLPGALRLLARGSVLGVEQDLDEPGRKPGADKPGHPLHALDVLLAVGAVAVLDAVRREQALLLEVPDQARRDAGALGDHATPTTSRSAWGCRRRVSPTPPSSR